jgi:putative peptidoglycan lipid II flippase
VTSNRALARAGIVVSGAFLISRVLGWVRVVVIVNTFAPGRELDAFFAAFRLPDLIYQLVAAGALSSALIPIVAGLLASDEHQRAWRVVSTVTNLMLAALAVLSIVIGLAAPLIVPTFTGGFTPEQTALTVDLTRIMLLSPIFLALGSVATSLLNAQGRFAASAVAPIVYNLLIIGATLMLSPSMGVAGVALGVVAGSLGHVLVQVPAVLGLGFRHSRRVEIEDPQARKALALMAPRAIGLGATQITFVVVTAVASTLGAGAITIFNTAFTLLQIPVGILGVPLGVVVFPALSREAAVGRTEEFVGLLSRALRLLLFVMLPIAGIGMVLRREVVDLLFGYGGFDAAAIDLTAATLLAFLVGLTAHALIAVLARAFYARQDTLTPVVAGLVSVAVNTTLAVALAGPLGLPGVGLAIAIGAWLEFGILLVVFKRRVPELAIGPIALIAARAMLATIAATAVAFALHGGLTLVGGDAPGKVDVVVRMVAVGGVGLATYGLLAAALRIPELPSIVGVMADLLRRPRRA